jgi:hypothetical protein
VGLRPSAVVRLERALAHEVLPLHDIGGAHPPVGGCARGDRDGRRRAASRRPRKLVTAERNTRSPPARSCREGGEGGRYRPQTPASITEKRPSPKTGRIPTADGPPGTPAGGGGTPEPTRPGASQQRCRAVDEAVSVAVAPRRTSGSRRAGRHPRSTDRRTARSPAPLASDLQRCRSVPDPAPGPAASVADRAQPVDTDVDPVRPRIHNG